MESATVANGQITGTIGAKSAVILLTGPVDLIPPGAPTDLAVTNEENTQVSLAWNAVSGAAGYNLYRSVVSGGGWIKLNAAALTGTTYTDTGLRNAESLYYVVRALDAAGNESGNSNEVNAMPHLVIGWANLQWPPSMTHTISAIDRTDNVYGQVWIDGVTNLPGPSPTLRAQLGYGPGGTDPASNPKGRNHSQFGRDMVGRTTFV